MYLFGVCKTSAISPAEVGVGLHLKKNQPQSNLQDLLQLGNGLGWVEKFVKSKEIL
jgi:hypothetical protein